MSAPTTIRMTLTSGLKGKTIVLNEHQFTDGICDFTGEPTAVAGISTYFTRSYQVKISTPEADEVEIEVEDDNEALREDDTVLGLEEEDKEIIEYDEPNDRQAAIIATVNGINQEDWVDKHSTPHPKVKDVAERMDDPTVKKAEIVEVVEKWLS